jgi:hypothetical protein
MYHGCKALQLAKKLWKTKQNPCSKPPQV